MNVVSQFLTTTPVDELIFKGVREMKVSVINIDTRKTIFGEYEVTVKIEESMGYGVEGMIAKGALSREEIAEKFSTGRGIVRVYCSESRIGELNIM
jgi:hypothetical protein